MIIYNAQTRQINKNKNKFYQISCKKLFKVQLNSAFVGVRLIKFL